MVKNKKNKGFYQNLYLPEKIGFILFIIFCLGPIIIGLIRLLMGDKGDAWGFVEIGIIFLFITWLNFGIVMIGQGLLTFNSYVIYSGVIGIVSILIQAFIMYI